MENITEKIDTFFKTAMRCYDKEIYLPSKQYFGIEQLVSDNEDEFDFKIQYGFPQSGSVFMNFQYVKDNGFVITGLEISAPPADKEFILATYSPETQLDGIGINASYGLDMGTERHSSVDDILSNPNALKMFDYAINDLEKAVITGECRLSVPIGSNTIPHCEVTNTPPEKGKKL